MRSINFKLFVLLVSSFILLQARPARATTIDPLIWEQMVLDAGFVGVVECETAGGIVARYRVIESWKGAPAGTRFTLRLTVNYWGPQFPVTFVGERYLVTAYKAYAPTRLISTTSGSPVPLWWRNIPADYHLPLWQGRERLPLSRAEKPLAALGSEHTDADAFHKAAAELLALSPEGQEVRLLQALARKYLFAGSDGGEKLDAKAQAYLRQVKSVQQKIEQAASPRVIALELLGLARLSPDARYSVGAVLAQGGGPSTLELLRSTASKTTPWPEEEYQRLLGSLQRRLELPPARREAAEEPAERERPAAEAQLRELRAALASGPDSKRFGEALELLTRHDPAPVAEYLVRWRNPEKDWWDKDYGYVLGSYFARFCGREREAHLQTLLRAQDPFIRVAGAVYLSIDNPGLGMTKLEELTKLPGDPGAWAALNLARRGQKAAVPRALEVLATAGPRGHMSGVPHENLQLRLLVLLSNSAAASGLAQPSPPAQAPAYDAGVAAFKQYQESFYRYYVGWWQANEAKIQLSDPWLTILEQQKVD